MNGLLFLLFNLSMFFIGAHLLDLGNVVGTYDVIIETLIEENDLGNKYTARPGVTNGFFDVSAVRIYHIGFWMMYGAFFLMTWLYIRTAVKNE